jgi:hypothetical protein
MRQGAAALAVPTQRPRSALGCVSRVDLRCAGLVRCTHW